MEQGNGTKRTVTPIPKHVIDYADQLMPFATQILVALIARGEDDNDNINFQIEAKAANMASRLHRRMIDEIWDWEKPLDELLAEQGMVRL